MKNGSQQMEYRRVSAFKGAVVCILLEKGIFQGSSSSSFLKKHFNFSFYEKLIRGGGFVFNHY